MDVDLGLSQLMGKRALYLTVLRLFLRDQACMVAFAEVAQAEGRLKRACRQLKAGEDVAWTPLLDHLRDCLEPPLTALSDHLAALEGAKHD